MKCLRVYLTIIISSTFLILSSCDQSQLLHNTDGGGNSQINPSAQARAATGTLSDDRYIVAFKQQPSGIASPQAAQEAVEKTTAIFSELDISPDSLIHQYKWASHGFAGRFSAGQAELIQKHPLVKYIIKDYSAKAIGWESSVDSNKLSKKASTSTQDIPWGIDRVGGPLDGTGKTAWILDSGIDLDHRDLNVDFDRSVSYVANEPADDLLGHGTQVAGVVAAIDNSEDVVGVAAGATVVSVKVCNQDSQCKTSNVKAGVDYVAGNFSPGDVANMSIWYHKDRDDDSIDLALSDLENAIMNAANGGVKFTLIAGNAAANANNYSPGRINNANIWTMSAFNYQDEFATTFSNYGNPPIDYGAPGVGIQSLYPDDQTISGSNGTSLAAPHVAGLLLTDNIIKDGEVLNDPDGDPDSIPFAASSATPFEVSGSVQNDHPRLDWPQQNTAVEYNVYRRYESSGDWEKWATVSTNYYVDQLITDSNLRVITQPDSPDNWVGYFVRPVDDSGNEGGDSNKVYFELSNSDDPVLH